MSEDPRAISKTEIMKLLKEGLVSVHFTKLNGEPRRMTCTWNEDYIPVSSEIKTKDDILERTEEKKEVVSLVVWDHDKADWRSFRLSSIYKVNAEKVNYAGS